MREGALQDGVSRQCVACAGDCCLRVFVPRWFWSLSPIGETNRGEMGIDWGEKNKKMNAGCV